MTADGTSVFFYGLFMDQALLASQGVRPTESAIGCVDGYRLHLGRRATLLPRKGERTYGVLMTITAQEAARLYSDPSVADYVAEPVVVTLPGARQLPAVCYNLPASKLTGTNPEYATALLALATKLGFPGCYLEHIQRLVDASQQR